MDLKLQLFIAGLGVAVLLTVTTAQNCQNNFVSSLYQCLGNRSLDRDNFFWIARNGTLGSKPTDVEAFTSRICIEKSGLFLCTKAALDNALAKPDSQCPSDQKQSLEKLFKGLFKTVETKCTDPCRATFPDEMAKCYTSQNFSKTLSKLNFTDHTDALMGYNKTEVERFCNSRVQIIQCLKLAVLQCKDSPIVLRHLGLDIDQLGIAYTTLCNHTAVYMRAAECFRKPSNQIDSCRRTVAQAVGNLEAQLDNLNITEPQTKDDLCRFRVDQLQCEMNAIQTQNNETKCHDAIIGMRRQQECILIPRECRSVNMNRLIQFCKNEQFYLPERDSYSMNSMNDAPIQKQSNSFIVAILAVGLYFSGKMTDLNDNL